MSKIQDPIHQVAHQLETKSAVKQQAYRNLCENFKMLEKQAREVVIKINEQVEGKDKDISLSVTKINKREFHVKIAGDLIIFIMHTNIIVLDEEHGYNKSVHVKDDKNRKYLGQIVAYNFMADTLKFNRLKDPGYLIARLMVNYENYFIVEGERQLNFMFEDVSQAPITETDMSIFVQLVISQAIDSDLVTPPFPKIRVISLDQKIAKTQALGGGQKLGFQMSYQKDQEPH